MIRKILLTGASAMAFSALVSATAADATTISFAAYPNGTPVTTVGIATFSLIGGPAPYGPPVTGPFGTYGYLGNSGSEGYPTSAILDVSFSAPVKNISFTFDNFGDNSYNGGGSFAATYDASHNILGETFVPIGGLYTVGGSGVRDLQFNNSFGTSRSWLFGVGEITFTPTSAVPEPSTWALLLGGFGFMGYVLRRRVLRAA